MPTLKCISNPSKLLFGTRGDEGTLETYDGGPLHTVPIAIHKCLVNFLQNYRNQTNVQIQN